MANERDIAIEGDARQSVIISGDRNVVVFSLAPVAGIEPPDGGQPSEPMGPAEISANPYRGLEAFTEQDAERFFGREVLTKRLWQTFRELHEEPAAGRGSARMLPILGPSGCGKSSVARAGLVPELVRRPLPGRREVQVAVLTPGVHPIEALATVLARRVTGDLAPVRKAREFTDELRSAAGEGNYDGLRRIADVLPEIERRPLIVLVDQLEEVYALCRDDGERDAFIATLLDAAADESGRVSVILTLRSDFLGAINRHPELSQVIADNGELVPMMGEDDLRRAITEPAAQASCPLDAGTIDLLIEQAAGREGTLPLLEFALTRIWDGMAAGVTPSETLTRLGGVGGALAHEAQALYDHLDDGDKTIARRAFLAMVQLGEGARDTRRRVALSEVTAHGEDADHVLALLRAFGRPTRRLLTLSAEETDGTFVEVTHEALFEHWQKLRDWLNESREDIRFHRRLSEQALHWDAQHRPDGLLWRPPDLDLLRLFHTRAAADLTTLEVDFFELSEREEQLRQSRRRWLTIGSLAAAAVMALLAVFSFQQMKKAERQGLLAKEQSRVALQQTDIATQQKKLAEERQKEAEDAKAKAEHQQELAFSRQLAAQATLALSTPPTELDTGALLAAESLKRVQTLEGSRAWTQAMALLPRKVMRLEHGGDVNVDGIVFSPDGSQLATLVNDGTQVASGLVRLSDPVTGREIARSLHGGWVTDFDFSNDGRWLATGGWDHRVIVVQVEGGEEAYRLELGSPVTSVAFDRQNRFLAVGMRDGRACVMEAKSGNESLCIEHAAAVVDLEFGPDGNMLATASEDKTVLIWNLGSGAEVHRLDHPSAIKRVAISPNGMQLATVAVEDPVVRVWSIGDGLLQHQLTHDEFAMDVVFGPSGQWIATGGQDETARLWKAETGTERLRVQIPSDWVAGVAFSPDGSRLVTVPYFGNEAAVWDTESALEVFRIDHDDDLDAASFSPDGRFLVSGGEDGTVRTWNAETGEMLTRVKFGGKINQIRFSPKGNLAVAVRWSDYHYSRGAVALWDPDSGQELGRFGDHARQMSSAAFSPDGALLATGSYDETARVWETLSGNEQAVLRHQGSVRSVAFGPRERLLTATDDRAVVWDLAANKKLADLTELGGVTKVAVSSDGRLAATSGVDDTIRVWNAETGEELAKYHSEGEASFWGFFALSPDGRLLAVKKDDGETIKIVDIRSGDTRAALAHQANVKQFVFSPDGKRLAVMLDSRKRPLWIWDIASQAVVTRILHSKEPQQALVNSFIFSPDGRLVATAGMGGSTVNVWNAETGGVVLKLPSKHPRGMHDVQFSEDGGRIVTCDVFNNEIKIWEMQTGKHIHDISWDRNKRGSIMARPVFSPDGRHLAFATWKSIEVWNTTNWEREFEATHDEPVKGARDLAFSPDGTQLATAGADMTARLWDLASGQELFRVQHHEEVKQVEFAAGGKVIISLDEGSFARAWNTENGQELFQYIHGGALQRTGRTEFSRSGSHAVTTYGSLVQVWSTLTGEKEAAFTHGRRVNVTALSTSGVLATVTKGEKGIYDNIVHVWDVASGRELFQLNHDGGISTVTFSVDDSVIVTSSHDRTVRTWDTTSGKELARFHHDTDTGRVSISDDKAYLAVRARGGRADEDVYVWHVPTKRRLARLPHYGNSVADLRFRPGQHTLATADRSATVRFWDPDSARIELLQLNHEDTVFGVAIDPKSKLLVAKLSFSDHYYVPIWDLSTGKELYRLVHGDKIWDMTLSADGKRLATGSSDHTARVWSAEDGREILRLSHDTNVHKVKFSPDRRWLASYTGGIFTGLLNDVEEDLLQVWDIVTRRKVSLSISGYINTFEFSPDSRWLVTAEGVWGDRQKTSDSWDSNPLGFFGIRIWDVASGDVVLRIPQEKPIRFAAFSPSGSMLATLSLGGVGEPVRLWDATTGEPLREFATPAKNDSVRALVFSSDWKYAATYKNRSYKEVQIWEVATGEQSANLVNAEGVGHLTFSPDSSFLAMESSGPGDDRVWVWDWREGRQVLELDTAGSVYAIKFTPDGSRIVTADKNVQVWQWRAEDLIADACSRLERNLTREEWRMYFGNEEYEPTCPNLPAPEK